MRFAVLGPGGVGGLIAGLLARAGSEVVVVARESTAERIGERGLHVQSVTFGEFCARVRACARLREEVDALVVATKADGLEQALERVVVEPGLVLPLLNGLDHLELLRRRFAPGTVLAGSIRVEADRPEAGVIVHTSPSLLIEMARSDAAARGQMEALAEELRNAGVPVRVRDSEAGVMWAKLVRLNALACMTSAHQKLLGEIRSAPELHAELAAAIDEACVVARAEGAPDVDPATALEELDRAHETLGSSMQRDIASGRPPELDAIPGAVLRAAARHGIQCPTIERLVAMIAARAGVNPPALDR